MDAWARAFVGGVPTDTLSLLKDVNSGILGPVAYRVRDEEGTQTPLETLALASGSCRDIAALFIAAVRHLGSDAAPSRVISTTLRQAPRIPVRHMHWGRSIFPVPDGSPSNARAAAALFSILCCTATNHTHIECRFAGPPEKLPVIPTQPPRSPFGAYQSRCHSERNKDDNNKATLPDKPCQSQ